MSKTDIYDIVSERILETIKKSGKLPWVKEWRSMDLHPANGVSKRPYDPYGINFFILSQAPYSSPYYLSFKQVGSLGGTVKKGERGWPIVFWKIKVYENTKSDGEKEVKTIPLLRYYTVFNVEQCEGIDIPYQKPLEANHDTIAAAEKIIHEYKDGPKIEIKESSRAYYVPSTDEVVMPKLSQFSTPEAYYSTFFHELGHSTGHKKRLDRKEMYALDKGKHGYGVEELTAELCAAFLCATAGIGNDTTEHNSAAYLKHWMDAIKEDTKLFVSAASKAGRAAKYILGIKKEETEKEEN